MSTHVDSVNAHMCIVHKGVCKYRCGQKLRDCVSSVSVCARLSAWTGVLLV